MTTINRIGGNTQQHRALTPYERGQMLTHYPTVGPIEMAERLHRTVDSVKYHWGVIRPRCENQTQSRSDFLTIAA